MGCDRLYLRRPQAEFSLGERENRATPVNLLAPAAKAEGTDGPRVVMRTGHWQNMRPGSGRATLGRNPGPGGRHPLGTPRHSATACGTKRRRWRAQLSGRWLARLQPAGGRGARGTGNARPAGRRARPHHSRVSLRAGPGVPLRADGATSRPELAGRPGGSVCAAAEHRAPSTEPRPVAPERRPAPAEGGRRGVALLCAPPTPSDRSPRPPSPAALSSLGFVFSCSKLPAQPGSPAPCTVVLSQEERKT